MLAKKEPVRDYTELYIQEIRLNLLHEFNLDPLIINELIAKFRLLLDEDPTYVYHYNSEYWASYIAEASGFSKNKLCV